MRTASLAVLSLALILTSGAFAACSSTDDADPVPAPSAGSAGAAGGAGSSGGRPLAVTNCKYDVGLREEYQQVFFPQTDAELAAGEVSSDAPNIARIRLGLGGKLDPSDPARVDPSTSVAIGWETDLATTATTVRWGKGPDPSAWVEGDVVDGPSYVVEPPAASPAGVQQRVHEAHLCGLEPDTTYYYRVGGGPGEAQRWSEVRSFRTLPSSADTPLVVGVTGDSRGELSNAWQLLQERLYKRGDVQLQLFSGDMIVVPVFQQEFLNWLDHLSQDAQGKPSSGGQILTLVAMGNHENYQSQFFASVVQPTDAGRYPKYGELFFSFDAGPAHIVVFDDYAIAGPGIDAGHRDALLGWLQADLEAAAARRAEHPWIVASHHHGEWSSSNHGKDTANLKARAALAPIWDKYGVDLVLNGHDHNYERSRPLRLGSDGAPSMGAGTTYVVCAGSGADGYGNGKSDFTETSLSYEDAGGIGVYGVMTLTRSKLEFEAHLLTAAGDDPVKDTFTLQK
jgi:acid phosphatase type 7